MCRYEKEIADYRANPSNYADESEASDSDSDESESDSDDSDDSSDEESESDDADDSDEDESDDDDDSENDSDASEAKAKKPVKTQKVGILPAEYGVEFKVCVFFLCCVLSASALCASGEFSLSLCFSLLASLIYEWICLLFARTPCMQPELLYEAQSARLPLPCVPLMRRSLLPDNRDAVTLAPHLCAYRTALRTPFTCVLVSEGRAPGVNNSSFVRLSLVSDRWGNEAKFLRWAHACIHWIGGLS